MGIDNFKNGIYLKGTMRVVVFFIFVLFHIKGVAQQVVLCKDGPVTNILIREGLIFDGPSLAVETGICSNKSFQVISGGVDGITKVYNTNGVISGPRGPVGGKTICSINVRWTPGYYGEVIILETNTITSESKSYEYLLLPPDGVDYSLGKYFVDNQNLTANIDNNLKSYYNYDLVEGNNQSLSLTVPVDNDKIQVDGVRLKVTPQSTGITTTFENLNITLPYTYDLPVSSYASGDKIKVEVEYYNTSCGGVYWKQPYLNINVLPACSKDVPDITIGQGAVEVNNGYGDPTFDGYQVQKGIDYSIAVTGVDDLSDYEIINNNGSDLTYNRINNTFRVNSDVGQYSLLYQPKDNANLSLCNHFVPLNIFVGGRNTTFQEPCLIYLNQYLIDKGFASAGTTISNFATSVKSSQGIIIEPGITLVDGAFLDIGVVDDDFVSEDTDADKTWIQSISYAENGEVIGQGRQYFDDMGRATQSQAYNYTYGSVMATEQHYDYQNRASLSTLSAPSGDIADVVTTVVGNTTCPTGADARVRGHFNYKGNFMTANGEVYSAKHFDGQNAKKPIAVDQSTPNTLGHYYSNYSINKVATTNYPFAQQVYYTDGTGKMKYSVGPGDVYRGASDFQHVGTSDSEDIYSDDAQTVLDQDLQDYIYIRNNYVFPATTVVENYKGKVFKETFTDPHGVSGFSYVTKGGQQLLSVLPATGTKSMSFYNKLGQVVCMITPNGVEQLVGTDGLTAATAELYKAIDKTTYEYNHRGELIATTEPDAGRTEFKYRRDGTLRFSQNALQAKENTFSYINYDRYNRPIESGEYAESDYHFNAETTEQSITLLLEKRGSDDGLTLVNKKEVHKTYYDTPQAIGFEQSFVRGRVSATEKVGVSKTCYSYDDLGRTKAVQKQLVNMGNKFITMDYTYDHRGNVKEVAYNRNETDAFYHTYTYDADNRLAEVYASRTAPVYDKNSVSNYKENELQATYEYYEHGPLKRVELGDELQGIDYVYTIEGWLKAINNPFDLNDTDTNVPDDIFGMSLDYYTGDYINADVNLVNTTHTGVQDYYNGTIKAQNWLTENHPLDLNTAASQKVSSYVYQYDNKYQLTAGLFGKRNSATTSTFSGAVNNALSTQSLSYDQNGNMLGLTRKDKEGVMMHDFVNKFHYETPISNTTKGKFTNQLDKVDGYADYTYDELGQLSQVSYTGGETMKLTYNPAGLVDKITDVNNVTKVAYEYDDMGQRIIKRNVTAGGTTEDWYVRDGNGTVVSIYRKEVDGSVNQIEVPVYGAGRLGQYQLGTADKIVYELKDHLGNVRAVLNRTLKNTNEIDLLSTMNYYPYGLKHGTIGEQYRYGYQGDFAEDETDETGFNSFQLRQYDPVIGRWISVDPKREFYSAYVGMGNNPVNQTDPDGGGTESTHTDADGNVIAVYNDGDLGVYSHENGTTLAQLDAAHLFSTSAGGTFRGSTLFWDEFVSPETGLVFSNYKIQFGKSFDPIIERMHTKAKLMDLKQVAAASKAGKEFDIKVKYANVGGLLNGKYATVRSAGNFLAGYNARHATYYGFGISFTTFQKLAGALHIENSHGNKLTKDQMEDIVLFGTYDNSSDISKFVAPRYGEVPYQYRMSRLGWNY